LHGVIDGVVGFHHERDVLVDAAGPDVSFVAHLSGAEPGAGTALPGPDVEVVADADDADRHRVSQHAIGPE
jgi:hypothetical protein